MRVSGARYTCFAKAIKCDSASPAYSWCWIGAKRGWFKLYEDRIECGSWDILFEEIDAAIVYRTRQWFIPVTVLQVVTQKDGFQFGFNPWSDPVPYLNIQTEERRVRLKYSIFSTVLRIVLLVAILSLIFG